MKKNGKTCIFLFCHEILHKDHFGVCAGKLRNGQLKKLNCNLQQQQKIFTVVTKTNKAAVQASLIISQITAKKSEPFVDGAYVKEIVMKATEILCLEKQQPSKNISVPANTVIESVNDLA